MTRFASFPPLLFSGVSVRSLSLLLFTLFVSYGHLAAAPENLGLGLKELVEAHEAAVKNAHAAKLTARQFEAVQASSVSAQFDAEDRVLVDVYLDGTVPLRQMVRTFSMSATNDLVGTVDWYRSGLLSMWVPLDQVASMATMKGVSAVQMTPKPVSHAGSVTSQGAKVLKSDTVNATYKGAGITVGILSDSYNKNTSASKTAAQDVASFDLPGSASDPYGNTTPVNVLEDNAGSGTDEGRAMCQIVHDVAPASPLAFATAFTSTADFANNIVALATPVGQTYASKAGAGCKVVCDDASYSSEPMFSDGVIAQAVDKATGLGATYFSSAGNDGNSGYIGTYSAQANNTTNQALLLSQGGITYNGTGGIPSAEQAVIASFHSFGTSGSNPVLVQKVLIPTGGATSGKLNFQWDDPSGVLTNSAESVSTDYDILVFSLSGSTATYSSTLSLTANNFSTNQPIEYNGGSLVVGTQYEFVIVRTTRTPTNAAITANQANHLRWDLNTDSQQIIADYVTPGSPNSFGHTSAATCNSTAAYLYDRAYYTAATTYTPVVEPYSSNGNATIYFDSAGNRLATPETRKQPTLAGVDGVNTTFFGSDADGDGYPNFFGTSAASPHGAGCAALLLNAASVLGKPLTPADVRAFLVNNTQGSSDQDPTVSKATLTKSGVAGTSITFTAIDHAFTNDPYSLNIAFTGVAGQQLTSLTITLPSGFAFFAGYYNFTAGPATGATPPTFTSNQSGNNTLSPATLTFTSFDPGDTLAFGVDRGIASGTGGSYYFTSNTDILAGTTLSATVTGTDAGTYTGTLANVTSRKWNYKSGYGLIDINAAVTALTNGN